MPRGGKRAGAGRKFMPDKKVRKSVTIRPDQLEKLGQGEFANDLLGIHIERALEAYLKVEVTV